MMEGGCHWGSDSRYLERHIPDPASSEVLERLNHYVTVGREQIRRDFDRASIHRKDLAVYHSCLTNLMRAGSDVVLVAEIAGHRRLETTRR
jgi:hypothetical protein